MISNNLENPFSGEIKAVEFRPIEELDNRNHLTGFLDRILMSDLPGFIIRKHIYLSDNLTIRRHIVTALNAIGLKNVDGLVLNDFSAQKDIGFGLFHVDRRRGNQVDSINVHTTISGAGNVLLAESGPWAAKITYIRAFEKILNKTILEGETDPYILSPIIHSAKINTEDHVIFPLTNSKGPLWHRFDTVLAPRMADISEVIV